MRIEKLLVRNFQQIASADLTFTKPVSVVFARNWHGKTSLARAIELVVRGGVGAFDGHSELTIGRVVRHGAASADVRAYLQREGINLVEVDRHVTAKGVTTKVNGNSVTKAAFDFFAPPGIVSPDAAFRVVMQTDAFLSLKPDVQKAVLESLVDQTVSAPDLKDARGALPLSRLGDFLIATLKDMAVGYRLAYDRRRDQKAALAGLPMTSAPAEPRQDVGAIRQRLAELRAEETRLVTAAGAASGERKTLASEATTLSEEVDRLAITLGEAQGSEGEAASQGLMDSIAKGRQAITDAQASHATYSERLADAERREGVLAQHRAKIKRLGEMKDGACPTCGLVMTKAQREHAITTWQTEETTQALEIATLRKKLKMPPVIEPLERRVRALQTQLDAIQRAQDQLNDKAPRLKALRERLAALPASSDEPAAELTALRKRLEQGEFNLRLAEQINARHDAHARTAPTRTALQDEVRDLERLCAALAPEGIRAALTLDRFGTMLERLNKSLTLFGLTMAVQQDPWELQVDGQPPVLMARSQMFLAGIALQLAVAHATGIQMAVIDGVDLFDGPNRSAFFAMLAQAVDHGLAQVIVLATYTDPHALTMPVPGWMEKFLVERTEADGGSTARALSP